MGTRVYISTEGRPVEAADAKVSVFDRGFLYGDSVYTTMRTVAGRPVEIDRHLARLRRSATGIGFEIPFSDAEIKDAIAKTHTAAGNGESSVRVVVTRGTGPIMLDPRQSQSPTLVILVQQLNLPEPRQYDTGISAVIIEAQKTGRSLLDPTVKSGNYLSNILALRQAIEQSGEDAILCGPHGNVAEGATSNVFMVRDGEVLTPSFDVGILPGITRQVVCGFVREAKIPLIETLIRPDDLRRAEEVFLTSSVRGIMPVTVLDGQRVGEGTAGPVTRELLERYAAYLDAMLEGT
jgi:branched-chain amino acid aminotransferase